MKKIPSLFIRNYEGDRKVRNEVVPGSEWVISGEGIATRKWDGMAVAIIGSKPYKRYDAKSGRIPPDDFVPAQSAPDPETGHWPGWVPAVGKDSARVLRCLEWGSENLFGGAPVPDGTYEACGPDIGTRHGANPEHLTQHILCVHGTDVLSDVPRSFDGIREWLQDRFIEGIVFHHEDGRMVKIKKSDFAY